MSSCLSNPVHTLSLDQLFAAKLLSWIDAHNLADILRTFPRRDQQCIGVSTTTRPSLTPKQRDHLARGIDIVALGLDRHQSRWFRPSSTLSSSAVPKVLVQRRPRAEIVPAEVRGQAVDVRPHARPSPIAAPARRSRSKCFHTLDTLRQRPARSSAVPWAAAIFSSNGCHVGRMFPDRVRQASARSTERCRRSRQSSRQRGNSSAVWRSGFSRKRFTRKIFTGVIGERRMRRFRHELATLLHVAVASLSVAWAARPEQQCFSPPARRCRCRRSKDFSPTELDILHHMVRWERCQGRCLVNRVTPAGTQSSAHAGAVLRAAGSLRMCCELDRRHLSGDRFIEPD